ncbi:cyclic nucleotide-binding domain-containing protein [Cyanobacteria bacterium FACHB-DQ100]|uniref:Crp/Fnr family transcriptional regulator n=1 Tax=Leptolyngbya sp. DQ-M1 TaxID=2933920 RepID=UPI0019CF4B57|nr:cyclic nucleotide-binding domain-containing protein [Cyanobacteria bacterium FACHB-DQ100]
MLNSFERLLLVRGVPIFKELRDDFLVRLASIMEERSYAVRETILIEGQEGRSMYVISKGVVRVHNGSRDLTFCKRGDFFGEMSLFDSAPRSASVTAIEPCECLVLTQQQLYEAVDETPGIALNLIKILSNRVRDMNKEIEVRDQEIRTLKGEPITKIQ